MDWLDLLAAQGTLKSLLQHRSLKASILWRSAFFTVQFSHPYMTTGKTIALIRQGFPGDSDGKASVFAGDPGSIPGSRRSPGEGNGNPLQYSCLENPQGQRSLVGYSPWDHNESDTTEATWQAYCYQPIIISKPLGRGKGKTENFSHSNRS